MIVALALSAAMFAPGERPPECVTVKVTQPAGAAWLEVCGSGPGQESPLHDWAPAAGPLIVDGFTSLVSPADCPRSAPCVLFASGGDHPS